MTMKTALALLALAATATVAVADANDHLVPPAEFDKPYQGKLTVTVARDQKHLDELCAGAGLPPGRAFACAEWTTGVCRIVLPPHSKTGKYRGYPVALIVRHEIAHCNGWARDHGGGRPFKTWADVEKSKPTTIPHAVEEAFFNAVMTKLFSNPL